MHNDAQIVRRALQAGATGYVDKGCTTDVLITAIRTVAARTRFIDPCLVDLLIQEAQPTTIERHRLLSPREMEILRLLAAGHSGGHIAVRLHLSPKTVSTHKKRLMHKLGVDSVAALVKYALAHDLLQRAVAL
jgi:DNA-binding NarL/FixJ family response regulator